MSARNAALPMSSSIVVTARPAVAATALSSAGKHALPVGLAERDEPHPGRNPCRRQRMQKCRATTAQAECRDRRTPRRPRPAARLRALPPAPSSAAHGHAARVVSRKARPCAVVSRWRSLEGAKATASSATAPSAAGSAAARWAWAKNTASQKPLPSSSITHSQSRSDGGVPDVAGFDRPFDAARIRERADRIGRRQPTPSADRARRLRAAVPQPTSPDATPRSVRSREGGNPVY